MLPRRKTILASLCAGVLVTAFLSQCFLSSRIKSLAWDEPGHIAAGLSYIQTGKFTINLQHPPLMKELSGLSLYLSGERIPETPQARQLLDGDDKLQWAVGSQIAAGSDSATFWARLPLILVAGLLGVVLFTWGRQMIGAAAGLGALFLFALDPTIVAHSYLVTMDVGIAASATLFFFLLWRYLRRPSLWRLGLCGLAMGVMLAAKFSAVMLLPVAAFVLVAAVWRPPAHESGGAPSLLDFYGDSALIIPKAGPNEPCPCGSGMKSKKCHGPETRNGAAGSDRFQNLVAAGCACLVMGVIAVAVLEVVYFFSGGIPLYLKGLTLVNADHNAGYEVEFAGRLYDRFLSYFLVAYLMKEPIASITLFVVGLVAVFRSKTLELTERILLLAPPAVLFGAHTLLADNLGIRYIIPCLPFVYLIGGLGLAGLFASGAVLKRAAAVVLCAWLFIAAAGIYPDHLSYFNESACVLEAPGQVGLDGGTRCGPHWLGDSNVDWGEGLKQLRDWLNRNAPGRKIHFAYFGSVAPQFYGLDYEQIGIRDLMKPPAPGLYVVSSHLFARTHALAGKYAVPATSQWLLTTKPKAIVGHCLYIYDVR